MTPVLFTPPLSLYIHYPWCIKKCPYCDFNSHQKKEENFDESAYIDALIRDLTFELPTIWGRKIYSIFIGGGTPSLMQPESLDRLFSQIHALLQVSPYAEITLEANPGTIDQVKFNEFKSLGINRLSIGIQSFSDSLLKKLGRIHSASQAHTAIDVAKTAGFNNINLDLMYGLPEQSLTQAKEDVSQLINHNPQHISYYQLTIEPNTFFAYQKPELPLEDDLMTIQEKAFRNLEMSAYQRYEVSAWSKPGFECKHNMNYWGFGDYLGIGPGAHGKTTLPKDNKIVRHIKVKNPVSYLNSRENNYLHASKTIHPDELVFEFILNATRLINGFSIKDFCYYTGLTSDHLQPKLDKAINHGLVTLNKNKVTPTELGINYLNDLQVLFLPESID